MNGRGSVAVSANVVDPAEFEDRVAASKRTLEHRASDVLRGSRTAPLSERAERLHRLYTDVEQAHIGLPTGIRSQAAYQVKRVVRKLTRWYVEAPWVAQKEYDAELARLASDTAASIAILERRVRHLEDWNEQILRRLRLFERAIGESEQPVE